MYEEVSVMDVLTSYHPAVWCGVIAAIVTFVIGVRLSLKGIIFSGKDKKLEAARSAGRTVLGRRVRCSYTTKSDGTSHGQRCYRAKYEYKLNGETKTYWIYSHHAEPPFTKWLYYDEKGKVFEPKSGTSPLFILVYVIPILVAYVVMTALGFDPQAG